MSDTTENNIEDSNVSEEKPKRGSKRSNKRMSELTKEAEAILKGFNEKDDVPEGRRATRSSTRGTTAVATPPPAKKDRKSSAGGGRRGRPKKGEVVEKEPAANDAEKEPETEKKEEAADEVEGKETKPKAESDEKPDIKSGAGPAGGLTNGNDGSSEEEEPAKAEEGEEKAVPVKAKLNPEDAEENATDENKVETPKEVSAE